MDWMEEQDPPPSWHDEGEIIPFYPPDDSYCPLTSMVRRCYLKHLEQTLIQNYECSRTKTIQRSMLHDFILHWERNALRGCMVTAIYQRAMLQVINTIKSDTVECKLTSVLTASLKKPKSRLVDVSTQTETETENGPSDPKRVLRNPKTETETEPNLNKESSVGSSDGPFLTPPSDYPPLNSQMTKSCTQNPLKRQLKKCFASQEMHVDENHSLSFQNTPFQMPTQFSVPSYPPLPANPYPNQIPQIPYSSPIANGNWSSEPQLHSFTVQPANIEPEYTTERFFQPETTAVTGNYNGHYNNSHTGNDSFKLPQVVSKKSDDREKLSFRPAQLSHGNQIETCPTQRIEDQCEQVTCKIEPETEVTLNFSDAPEPDYNWDQIEEEMARLCGQVFTEKDNNEPNVEEKRAVVLPEPPNNWEMLGKLHEEELEFRLNQIRQNWSLERQAKLKRRFIELFGREENEDLSTPISAKEAARYKQRIAPWVVKHLMPLYKEKRIASRHVFKSLAKHISDLLIERNLCPDECDVWMGVQEFFRGGTTIQCEADFCV